MGVIMTIRDKFGYVLVGGIAFAIILDATVVRALLVPALMRIAGDWNWWAPAPLRRLHKKIGLAH